MLELFFFTCQKCVDLYYILSLMEFNIVNGRNLCTCEAGAARSPRGWLGQTAHVHERAAALLLRNIRRDVRDMHSSRTANTLVVVEWEVRLRSYHLD